MFLFEQSITATPITAEEFKRMPFIIEIIRHLNSKVTSDQRKNALSLEPQGIESF